jgi:hypothetical protein
MPIFYSRPDDEDARRAAEAAGAAGPAGDDLGKGFEENHSGKMTP